MQVSYLKIVKISVGCCIAVFLAGVMGLSSATSAGIIALLSIQDTRRATFSIAGKRFAAFGIALLIAISLFSLMGFSVLAFGAFLLAFTFICYAARLENGISMSTVLVLHLWNARSLEWTLLLNELILLCIGVGIAVLVNLYMPQSVPAIRQDQKTVDSRMRSLIAGISRLLDGSGTNAQEITENFEHLECYMECAVKRAYDNMNNSLITDMRYYVQYMEMRKSQCRLLMQIVSHTRRLWHTTVQADRIAEFMQCVSDSFDECNNAVELQHKYEALRASFREFPLPQSREEFETRAVLFQIVNDLGHLIRIKKHFADELTDWQIETFWKACRLKINPSKQYEPENREKHK